MPTPRIARPTTLIGPARALRHAASQRACGAAALLAVTAIAAVVALPALASSPAAGARGERERPGAGGEQGCGAATDGVYLSSAVAVALQIAAGERHGAEVARAVRTIESDRVLAQAVAAGDLATVRSEVLRLVYNGEHIVRLRVLRAGQLLDDLGGSLVLAPVEGSLRANGRVVGTFVMSIQDDAGYQKLLERLVGADSVMRYQGQTVLSNIDVGSEPLPDRGTVVVAGVPALVASFPVGRFPDGELDVSLVIPPPPPPLARMSCAEVGAGVLAAIAQRIYGEATISPWWVGNGLAALARTPGLAAALSVGDTAAAAQIVQRLVAAGGFTRLRVVDDAGSVVADVGLSTPSLAPVSRPLVDGAGEIVGEATFTVLPAETYVDLAHSLVAVPVLVRAATQQLAGNLAGPTTLPSGGEISFEGGDYAVASFAAVEFPDTPARVFVLDPG